MKRAEKEKEIELLKNSIGKARSLFLVDYRGLKVNQINELRKRIHGISNYRVVKNRLALKALADFSNKKILKFLKEPTGFFYTHNDPIALAKILVEFVKDNPELEFKAGLVENTFIMPEDFKELSRTPSKLELIGKLLYCLNYPIAGLVRILNANIQGLATALDQVAKSKSQ
ncbi:MAG: 50S ribosomal protein L10 [Acidobacteriota bacterium]